MAAGGAPARPDAAERGEPRAAREPPRLALWVPAIYALASGAWIALSDAFVAKVAPSVQEQAAWSMLKGFGFVVATTLALHAGLRWALARERRAEEELRRAERALRRYELLAELGRDIILFLRLEDGRILDANAAAAEAYGWSREELRARTVLDLRTPGSAALAAAQMAAADAGGARFDTVHRRRDGSTFPVEVSSFGSTLDGVRVLVSVVRDVTERTATEEALRESEERLALAVEAAELGTWHAVPFGPMEWSPRCRQIFGVHDAVIPDFDAYLRLVHPDDRERVRGSVARWLHESGDGRYHDEYRCLRPDGTVRWVASHGKARFVEVDGVRRPVQLAGTLLDVTELKAVQAQLMQSDRLASVGMLAAGVAHEINNPLAYLTAALDFVAQHAPALAADGAAERRAEVLEALAEAREGAARVRHVVRDLSTFSRMQEERRARVDLGPIIESAIHMAGNEIRYRARLVREYGTAPAVLANEARLGQVLLNLLINAAQAIPEGRVEENEIRVVTATDEKGRAVVEVRDTGPGIPPGLVDRIFDPFFTTKPKGVGTGLGLSICRSIVVGLGGEIAAENRSDPRGATFRLVLPAAPATAAEEPGPAQQAPSPSVRRGRVLVVDDEPNVAAAIRRVLAAEHDVVVLTRAEEAWNAVARGERFDAIVCDLMMPQMTGMDLHASLERLAPDQARRMVVLTGGAFTDGAREFLDRVALPRFEKPFDTASLRATVRGLVA